MTPLEQLIALEAIRQLKYRYIRAMDTRDLELMERCFSQDATIAFADGLYSASGRAAIVEFYRSVLTPAMVSSHVVTHPEIVFRSPVLARGIWRVQDTVFLTEANPSVKSVAASGGEELRGAAYYYDEYVCTDGTWVMSHSGYKRIFRQVRREGVDDGVTLTLNPSLGVRDDWI